LKDINGIFNSSFAIFEKALNVRSKKHQLIASNISNMDTPGYKAFDIAVNDELNKTTFSGEKMNLTKTNPEHLSSNDQLFDNITYQVQKPSEFSLKKDGNTVDLDKEMSSMAENSLMYNAAAQILSRKFQIIKDAIKGDR
jgi:flagellar basal-body rod protein FlgB